MLVPETIPDTITDDKQFLSSWLSASMKSVPMGKRANTCVHVSDGRVESFNDTASRVGSAEQVEEACRDCGKCCFGLAHCLWWHRPLSRCVHLSVESTERNRGPDQEAMNSVVSNTLHVNDDLLVSRIVVNNVCD